MKSFTDMLLQKKELYILFLMLEMLHISIWFDFGSLISRSLMLSHLGMFLLWQPVWRGDEKLSIENTILFIFFTLTLTFWLNLWLLFAWLVLLIGFVSGRVAYNHNERIIYLLALSFLVAELLFACVPEIAKIDFKQSDLLKIFLSLIPMLILFFPSSTSKVHVQAVDFIHAITTAMLTSLVALGSLLNMFLSQTSYFVALTQTSIVIGVFILCISWLLTSRSRFTGISQLWSSYMLNIGTPFEQWLSELSRLNEKELSPDQFIYESMLKLVEFNWISGIEWDLNSEKKEIGNKTKNNISINVGHFNVTLFTHNSPGAALRLHCNLLVRLLYNFYLNKVRENELTKQAHLKAIYETGARITHDIKNLLQSLQAITSIITHDSSDVESATTQQVLKRQLPNLTQRLQLALDKLQTPGVQDTQEIYLKDWWSDVQKRNSFKKINFNSVINGDPMIPVDLFDSVIDNLIENIEVKQINEPDITISIALLYEDNLLSVTVCDNGSKIPDNIARDLLVNAISSDNGLGIGLYQANKHAEMFGYKLLLVHNQDGRVCFEFCKKID